MAADRPYGRHHFGRWYTFEEAQEVERDLRHGSGTGDSWVWRDSKGNRVEFTARNED